MRQQQSRTATSQLNTTPAPIDKGPARLDLIQGASGLLLVLFMWVHMGLVSSILISKDAMHAVTRAMEGEFLFRRPVPGLVSAAVLAVAALVLVHALASIRRMPASYREYRGFMKHARMLRHADTWLWLLQVITGLVLMFVVAIHLYEMAATPGCHRALCLGRSCRERAHVAARSADALRGGNPCRDRPLPPDPEMGLDTLAPIRGACAAACAC